MAGNIEVDDRGVIVACAACGKKNRLAFERLGDSVQCGECKAPIKGAGEPIEITRHPISIRWWRRRRSRWSSIIGRRGGPCRMVAELQKVAARQAARLRRQGEHRRAGLGQRFGIRSIPTLAVFEGGKELARESGARRRPDRAFIARARAAVPTP